MCVSCDMPSMIIQIVTTGSGCLCMCVSLCDSNNSLESKGGYLKYWHKIQDDDEMSVPNIIKSMPGGFCPME
jgi:hypothetical protein